MALNPHKRNLYSIAQSNLNKLVEHTKLPCEMCNLLKESGIATNSEAEELNGYMKRRLNSKGASYLYNIILPKIDGVSICEDKFLRILHDTGNFRALQILQYSSSGMNKSSPGIRFTVPTGRILHGLPNCDPDFIGRVTELSELQKRYKEAKKPIVVSGLGGIGKTCLVRRSVEMLSTDVNQPEFNVIWINGGRHELEKSVLSVFTGLYKEYFQIENDPMALEKYVREISAMRRTLLVVDNLEEMCDYLHFICLPIPAVSVVVTSRNVSILDTYGDAFKIRDLTDEEAQCLFNQVLPQNNVDGTPVSRLCSALQNFPLSLIQVAHYIGIKRNIKLKYNVDIFLNDFTCLRKKTDVLSKDLPILRKANYNFSTISTWDRTVQDICNHNSAISRVALLLLKILSFGNSQTILEQDFYDISNLNSVASQGIWNTNLTADPEFNYEQSDIEDGFEMLAKFSLLECDIDGQVHDYRIHKVLQTVIRLKSPQQWRPLPSFLLINADAADRLLWEISSGYCARCRKDCLSIPVVA